MFQKRTGIKPKPWMGLLGLLGFTGFLGFIFKEHFMLVFFSFFNFFSFYWWAKIDYDIEDERLIKNQQKAVSIAYNFLSSCIMIGMIVAVLSKRGNEFSLMVLLTFCSLAVGITSNIEGYLLYKYENEMD